MAFVLVEQPMGEYTLSDTDTGIQFRFSQGNFNRKTTEIPSRSINNSDVVLKDMSEWLIENRPDII